MWKLKCIFRYYFNCFSADNFPCNFCCCCCMCSSHLLTFCLFYCCSCCWEWVSLFYGKWQWLDVKIRIMALGQQQKLVLFARGLYRRINKSTNGRIWRSGFVNRSNGRTVYYMRRVLFFLFFFLVLPVFNGGFFPFGINRMSFLLNCRLTSWIIQIIKKKNWKKKWRKERFLCKHNFGTICGTYSSSQCTVCW